MFKDLVAALVVAVVLIPQSVGNATLAGLAPQAGMYAALLAVAVAAMWGSSHYLSTGPDAVSSLLTLGAVSLFATVGSNEYVLFAAILAMLVGLIRFLIGFFNQGKILYFIPHSVITGFVAAAGIIIIATQLPNMLGIKIPSSDEFLHLVSLIISKLGSVNMLAFEIGLASFLLVLLLKQFSKKIPGSLVVLVLGTVASFWFGFKELGIPIVGSIDSYLPSLVVPTISFEMIVKLLGSAAAIAIVGFSEAFAVAESLAVKEKKPIDINQELVGQGLGSIAAGLLGGYPVSGSLSRTALNHTAGAQTYLSSMFVSLFLIVFMLFAMPALYFIPKTVLAATIIAGVITLIDIKKIVHLFMLNKYDGILATSVVVVALVSKLEYGLFTGILLALFFFLRTVMSPRITELCYNKKLDGFYAVDNIALMNKEDDDVVEIPRTLVVRIDMSFVYFNGRLIAERLIEMLHEKQVEGENISKVVIDATSINVADVSGVEAFEHFSEYCETHDIQLVMYRLKVPVEKLFNDLGIKAVVLTDLEHLKTTVGV